MGVVKNKKVDLSLSMSVPRAKTGIRKAAREVRGFLYSQLGRMVIEEAVKRKGVSVSRPKVYKKFDEYEMADIITVKVTCTWK